MILYNVLSVRSPLEFSTALETVLKEAVHRSGSGGLDLPAHGNPLRKGGLVPSVFAIMGELWERQGEKLEKNKEWDISKKKNRNVYFCVAYSRYLFTAIHRMNNRLKKLFNLIWWRVRMSYHRYNNLVDLLNGDLAAKIGRNIFFKDLMDRERKCSFPSKVSGKCFYEGKCRSKCNINEVKWSTYDAIYI